MSRTVALTCLNKHMDAIQFVADLLDSLGVKTHETTILLQRNIMLFRIEQVPALCKRASFRTDGIRTSSSGKKGIRQEDACRLTWDVLVLLGYCCDDIHISGESRTDISVSITGISISNWANAFDKLEQKEKTDAAPACHSQPN